MEREENTERRIERILTQAFAPESLELRNDSQRHAGHPGAGTDTHFSLHIVAAAFEGKSRVARHRLVYEALQPELDRGLHALAIRAYAPGETVR